MCKSNPRRKRLLTGLIGFSQKPQRDINHNASAQPWHGCLSTLVAFPYFKLKFWSYWFNCTLQMLLNKKTHALKAVNSVYRVLDCTHVGWCSRCLPSRCERSLWWNLKSSCCISQGTHTHKSVHPWSVWETAPTCAWIASTEASFRTLLPFLPMIELQKHKTKKQKTNYTTL